MARRAVGGEHAPPSRMKVATVCCIPGSSWKMPALVLCLGKRETRVRGFFVETRMSALSERKRLIAGAGGGLLLPRKLVTTAISGMLNREKMVHVLPDDKRNEAEAFTAETFDVNPAVARIRLHEMFPVSQQISF